MKYLISLTLFIAFILPLSTSCSNKNDMREITTAELVMDMGVAINLGNTMEANGSWIDKYNGISSYEKAWGSPLVNNEMIKGYADAGFNCVRIPVAWYNLMADDNTINPELMDRVEQIVKYVLDNGMYAIVNMHHNGWFENFPTEFDKTMDKYSSIWTQISERFKDYNDYLMLESLNEEGVWNDVWDRWGDGTGKKEAYDILNRINQKFVDVVRSSGGNNAKRHLLIAGYATSSYETSDPLFKMPDDPINRCAISLHYYGPFGFTHLTEEASWGEKARFTWGTEEDYAELDEIMDYIKVNFADKGVPVIIGEYGVAKGGLATEEICRYTAAVCKAVFIRGMCPVLWDAPGSVYYDRYDYKMIDPNLEAEFNAISKLPRL